MLITVFRQDSAVLLEDLVTIVSKNPNYYSPDLTTCSLANLKTKIIPRDELKLLEEIGEGAFGKVYKGKLIDVYFYSGTYFWNVTFYKCNRLCLIRTQRANIFFQIRWILELRMLSWISHVNTIEVSHCVTLFSHHSHLIVYGSPLM